MRASLWALPLLLFALSPPVTAQRPVSRIFVTPPYGAGADAPAAPSGARIFVDAPADELVVERDGPDRAGSSQVRVRLRNGAGVRSEGSVQRLADGVFAYRFILTTAGSSRAPLHRWSLLAPRDPEMKPTAPSRWFVRTEPSGVPDRIAAQDMLLDFIHFEAAPGAEVAPGERVEGFEIESRLRPGFVTDFAWSGSEELRRRELEELPADVRADVERALTIDLDSQRGVVLGPRYGPDATSTQIAAGYHMAVTRLVQEGRLARSSPFVTGALDGLSAHLRFGSEGVFTSTEAAFLSSAKTPEEKAIAEALRWSLGLER